MSRGKCCGKLKEEAVGALLHALDVLPKDIVNMIFWLAMDTLDELEWAPRVVVETKRTIIRAAIDGAGGYINRSATVTCITLYGNNWHHGDYANIRFEKAENPKTIVVPKRRGYDIDEIRRYAVFIPE